MNRIGTVIFLILAIGANQLMADSVVIVPDQFNVIKVNGKDYDQGLLEKEKQLLVKPGINKLILKYEDIIDLADGEFETITSRDIIVVIDVVDEKIYRIVSERPSTLDAARAFANSPKYNIEISNGNGQASGLVQQESMAIQQLKHWWLQADESDKQAFLSWVNEQGVDES